MKAVPAKAHARGSRYQGEMAMRYSARPKEIIEVITAPHARRGLSSNTCASRRVGQAAGDGNAMFRCAT